MKLVGASNWFVRGPFVIEGLACGLIGSVLAVFLLVLGKELALPQIVPRFDAGDAHAWPFPLLAAILHPPRPLPRRGRLAVTLRRSCASDRRAQPARQAARRRAVLHARHADHDRPQGR